MKKIFIMLAGALMLLASCQKPHFVEPTAERQGITSLSAIFTFGPYMDMEIVRYQIGDPDAERFVIPIPYYYPEASFDETTPYMTKVRVQAELQPNCLIEPSLGDHLLDLTQENWFTYTNAQGESRPICITGERVKSDKWATRRTLRAEGRAKSETHPGMCSDLPKMHPRSWTHTE